MVSWDVHEAMFRMQVGDSFFIPTLNPTGVIQSIYAAAREVGIDVTCHHALSHGVFGVRTWRVAPEDIADAERALDMASQVSDTEPE